MGSYSSAAWPCTVIHDINQVYIHILHTDELLHRIPSLTSDRLTRITPLLGGGDPCISRALTWHECCHKGGLRHRGSFSALCHLIDKQQRAPAALPPRRCAVTLGWKGHKTMILVWKYARTKAELMQELINVCLHSIPPAVEKIGMRYVVCRWEQTIVCGVWSCFSHFSVKNILLLPWAQCWCPIRTGRLRVVMNLNASNGISPKLEKKNLSFVFAGAAVTSVLIFLQKEAPKKTVYSNHLWKKMSF